MSRLSSLPFYLFSCCSRAFYLLSFSNLKNTYSHIYEYDEKKIIRSIKLIQMRERKYQLLQAASQWDIQNIALF